MPSGVAGDTFGIIEDDDISGGPSSSDDDGRLVITAGNHNPFYDFRWRGDPGGIGYLKLHTQYQVLQNQRTGLAVGFQAVTPAGRECDGVDDGPTILSPNVAWFHDLGNGTAIQGFVGKDVRASAFRLERSTTSIQYGLAFQQPLPLTEGVASRNVHLVIQALGRYRTVDDPTAIRPMNLSLLPGIHWRMSDSWWLSSGVNVPIGPSPSRPDNMLQITCSWQF
jgi:hypothetical protein